MSAGKLSLKQELFAREYLVDLNAAAAYRRAGYQAKNDHTAATAAHKLLTNADIQAAIQAARAAQNNRLELSADRVLLEVKRIAFSDPRRFYNADGALKAIAALGDDEAAALASVETFEEYTTIAGESVLVGHVRKVKRWDKLAALGRLMKHLGIEEPKAGDNPTATEAEEMPDDALLRIASTGGEGSPPPASRTA